MNNGTQTTLTIQRISQGGYLVWPCAGVHDFREPIFACTTIDEALEFMRDMIAEAVK